MWQELDLGVGGLRLHVTRTGGGMSPLVVLHGITDDGLCWTALAEALADRYDVVMVDARGHGRSEAPPAGYTPDLQAGDVSSLVAVLGLDRPVVLGHSMGAATAIALAALQPQVPRAILLEDPPPWWMPDTDTPGQVRAWREERAAGVEAMKRKTHDQLMAEQRRDAPTWSDAEVERWARSKQRCSPRVATAFLELPGVAFDPLLPRITCPVLLLTADPERGALVTPDAAAAFQGLVPHAEIAPIAGGGHSMRHDQPQAYLAAVRSFLERV